MTVFSPADLPTAPHAFRSRQYLVAQTNRTVESIRHVLYGDFPVVFTGRPAAGAAAAAAKINQGSSYARPAQKTQNTIDGVAFADAAEVNDHVAVAERDFI